MRHFTLIIIFLLSFQFFALSQDEPVLAWLQKELVGSIGTEPKVAADSFGNVFSITTDTWNTLRDFTLIKYDSIGNKLWERHYDGGPWELSFQGAFTLDKEGNIYVGISYGAGLPDFNAYGIILKYDTYGDLLWDSSPTIYADNGIAALCPDTSDLLYALGYSFDIEVPENYMYVACLSQINGYKYWQTEISGNYFPQSMRLHGDRLDVFLTEYKPDGRYNTIQQYDLQGNLIQTHSKPDPALFQADFNHIMADGSIIFGNRGFLYSVTRVDEQVDTIWHYHLPNNIGSPIHRVLAIAEDNFMNVYATGCWTQANSMVEMVTTKFSKEGELLWQHFSNSQGDSIADCGDGILVDSKYVYTIGSSDKSNTNWSLVFLAHDKETGELAYYFELDTLTYPHSVGNYLARYEKGVLFCGHTSNENQSTSLLIGRFILPDLVKTFEEIERTTEANIEIYPNPAKDEITVSFTEDAIELDEIQIIDLSGRTLVKIRTDGSRDVSVNLDKFSNGTYFLKAGQGVKKFFVIR